MILIFIPANARAASTDWLGYDISAPITYYESEGRAWYNGYFRVHLAKDGNKYATLTCSVALTNATEEDGSKALFERLRDLGMDKLYDLTCWGDTNHIQIANA